MLFLHLPKLDLLLITLKIKRNMASCDFSARHIGPREHEIPTMLEKVGVNSMEKLIDQTIPQGIRLENPLELSKPLSEHEYFNYIKKIASKNKLYRTFIGMGYYNTFTPPVILRNILENPSWYTSYTPYQAEISQGRLEALLNFQTMVMELTGMEIANASLLDEGTGAAEAMLMQFATRPRPMAKAGANVYFIDENIFPQTLEVIKTRAIPVGIEIKVGKYNEIEFDDNVFGALVQYPAADGKIKDYSNFVKTAHDKKITVTAVADLMSLVLLTPPGEWGADIVTGTTQRFGIPMGYGGPHAAYFATSEKYKRNIPGRIIGVSKDSNGNHALRMALQTREQHIKRERATSNICTAQALLATMAGMYAVYHGAKGLKKIATNIHNSAVALSEKLVELGYTQENENYFDTLKVNLPEGVNATDIEKIALSKEFNLRYIDDKTVGISTDETTSNDDLNTIADIFAEAKGGKSVKIESICCKEAIADEFKRTSAFMELDLFKRYRSESEMMRYIKKLERRDISLTHSMISLGSCTMKLNAAVEMLPVSWPEFGSLHPFIPVNQAEGYHEMFEELKSDLSKITGFADVSLQPNSGASGEYAGLMVIRAYHQSRGEGHRNVVIIPASAHGTNPASAAMAGAKIVIVKCDEKGNIDIVDLKEKAEANKDNLSAFMVTYPSTHGVFESAIKEMCQIIHDNGGQVYMDGANMNAQIGYTNPAVIGADVCHLNLHKTFAIPHGGGGPGVGPIGVAAHLVPFLPSHPVIDNEREGNAVISAAPWGSASVLPITFGYIKMLGAEGLKKSTEMAILNANYIASRLQKYYNILYTGENGRVAHEMIIECRNFKAIEGITEADIAKRLMDFGFHAPTLSFPVHGTLMAEPTESESLQELDRFIDAMIAIHGEIMQIKDGKMDASNNVLKNAPHTQKEIVGEWEHPYSRKEAAFPLPWVEDNKFWPFVSRIDDAYGDRNLFCSCAPIDEYINEIYK